MSMNTIIAGLVGTAMMTAVMLLAPYMGMPEMNTGEMMNAMMGVPVWMGWIIHFIIGIIFAVIYSKFLNHRLPIDNDIVRGVAYGGIVFVFAQIMMGIAGAMGMAPEMDPNTNMVMMVIGSLIGHLVFGLGLGFFIKRPVPASA